MKTALLIVNPYSTHVTGRRITEVSRELAEHVELRTEFTQAPGHATQLAAEASAADVDAIVVFSGDGTYNEALNGAHGTTPFGFLPGGGTSVFPRALGLPRDPVAAHARSGWPSLRAEPGASRSVRSTAAASASPPGSASTARPCAGSTGSGATPAAPARATERSCG